MRLADKHDIRAPIHRYRFDPDEMREAWRKMEQREEFEAPVVALEERQGGAMRM
jgi:acetyl-CoA carboxylase alpha subunit